MTYTLLAVAGVIIAGLLDLWVLRTKLLRRKVFWAAYAIIVVFQLVTNAILTGLEVVRYNGAAIIGNSSPAGTSPTFLGDGRIAYAPFEDLLFGFALILLSQSLWVWWGRRAVQRTPYAGPPRVRWFSPRR